MWVIDLPIVVVVVVGSKNIYKVKTHIWTLISAFKCQWVFLLLIDPNICSNIVITCVISVLMFSAVSGPWIPLVNNSMSTVTPSNCFSSLKTKLKSIPKLERLDWCKLNFGTEQANCLRAIEQDGLGPLPSDHSEPPQQEFRESLQ